MDNNNLNNNEQGQFSQQTQYQQTDAYTPVANVAPYQPVGEEPVSLGDWIGTILLFHLIPCVGFIVYLVWAFSKDTKPSKKNYCRAWLIYYAVVFVIELVAIICFATYFVNIMSEVAAMMGNYPMY